MATTVEGIHWPGNFGARGVHVPGCVNPEGMPAVPFMAFKTGGGAVNHFTPVDSTQNKACPKPDGTGKVLSGFYTSGTSLDVRLDIADEPQRVTFYVWDYYGSGAQKQSIKLYTLQGAPLDDNDPFIISGLLGGQYVTLDVPGPCIARWTRIGGYVATVNGIFLDGPLGPPPDNVAPIIVSGTVDATGKVLQLAVSEPVTGHDGFALKGQAELPITLEYVSGDPDGPLTFNIVRHRPIYRGEIVGLSYTGESVRDGAGNLLMPFDLVQVANLSDAQPPVWQVLDRRVIGQSDAHGIRTCTTLEALLWPEG